MLICELFEPQSSFEVSYERQGNTLYTTAYDRQGREINITMGPGGIRDAVDIEFMRGGSFDLTGRGDAERVFGTVLQAIKYYFSTIGTPKYIIFHSKEGSRSSLYQALVKRFAGQFGYTQLNPNKLPPDLQDEIVSPSGIFLLQKTPTLGP
jgi:hypothetical protein